MVCAIILWICVKIYVLCVNLYIYLYVYIKCVSYNERHHPEVYQGNPKTP